MTKSSLAPALSPRIVSLCWAVFGAWTIFTNLSVALEINFSQFRYLALAGMGACILVVLAMFRRAPATAADSPATGSRDADTGSRTTALVSLGLIASLLIAYRLTGSFLIFWAGASGLLLWVSAASAGTAASYRSPPAAPTWLFPLMLVATAGYVVFKSNANLDDSFYQSLIAGLLDHPGLPMLKPDTLRSAGTLPIHNDAYLALSLEPLLAVVTFWTGLDHFLLKQFVVAPLAAIASVLLWAEVFRRSVPRTWEVTLAVFLLLITVFSVNFRSIGGFFFNYLLTGKSLFVACVVPAIILRSLDSTCAGGWRSHTALFLTCAAGVGLTPNAIYLAPLAAGMCGVAVADSSAPGMRRLAATLASTGYPVLVGVLLLAFGNIAPSEVAHAESAEEALRSNLGWGFRYWAVLPLILACPFTARDSYLAKVLGRWLLVYFLLILNPWLAASWGEYVTGNLNWRLHWSFPLLAMAALSITAIASLVPVLGERRLAAPSLLLLLALAFPGLSTISWDKWNGFSASMKAPTPEYRIAKVIARVMGQEDRVLAPKRIAAYVVTVRSHPIPVVSRPLYTYHVRYQVPTAELRQDYELYSIVDPEGARTGAGELLRRYLEAEEGASGDPGHSDKGLQALGAALAERRLGLVVFDQSGGHAEAITALTAAQEYSCLADQEYQLCFAEEARRRAYLALMGEP